MKRFLLGAVAVSAFTSMMAWTAVSSAQETNVRIDEPASAPTSGALGRKQDFWRFGMALRVGYVGDPGFDVFAKQDYLPQWSLEGQRTLLVRGRLSLSAGLGWDVGARSGRVARGSDASLLANRFAVPIEGRYHLFPWLYGFGKIAPGASHLSMRIHDASSTSTLVANGWAFSADLSVGASILLGPHRNPEKRLARVWATPEFGYAWSTAVPLTFAPEGKEDDPRPVGNIDLGTLALRGPFFRIGVGMSF